MLFRKPTQFGSPLRSSMADSRRTQRYTINVVTNYPLLSIKVRLKTWKHSLGRAIISFSSGRNVMYRALNDVAIVVYSIL